jgi:hypothetical protein
MYSNFHDTNMAAVNEPSEQVLEHHGQEPLQPWDPQVLAPLLEDLKRWGIFFEQTEGTNPSPEAVMPENTAVAPMIIVSPRNEWGVTMTLQILKTHAVYDRFPVSVKSRVHEYFNVGVCYGVVINLGNMIKISIGDDKLNLEPGCLLGQVIHFLKKHRKAVLDGNHFGVGADGHFLATGLDLVLGRSYGLGSQSIVGGRVALWDGSVLEVNETSHPDHLHAMRRGTVAEVGIVTQIHQQLIDEPPKATWLSARIDKEQLKLCVRREVFTKAVNLPLDITVSFRFYFQPPHREPVCSFNIVSLLSIEETIDHLYMHLGYEVATMVSDNRQWNETSLVDLRTFPGSKGLSSYPDMLVEILSESLRNTSLVLWNRNSITRETGRTFSSSISQWVVPECEPILANLYEKFESIQSHKANQRMYALVILGGGGMKYSQQTWSMPVGQALARFAIHWDDPEEVEAGWYEYLTQNILAIFQERADQEVYKPCRGDVWLRKQEEDEKLSLKRPLIW